MQVFEVFYYNLNQLKFKDNKVFFENLLKKLRLKYTDIAFLFSSDQTGEICERTIKLFPVLKEYRHFYAESELYFRSMPNYCFSSVDIDENKKISLHINKQHNEDFSALLKKIPKVINYGFMGVVLDKVNWYGNEAQKPAFFQCSNSSVFNDHNFNSYYSNSIRFVKEFDYGNRYNPVKIMIDRTDTLKRLRPYPDTFKDFILELGKPLSRDLKCVFDSKEREVWRKAAETIKELSAKDDYSNLLIEFKNDLLKTQQETEDYLMYSITPIKGISLKSILGKFARKNRYSYISCTNGCYQYQKVNENNHTILVEFMHIPFSSLVDGSVSIMGYNFVHHLCKLPRLVVKDKTFVEKYAEKVFEAAVQIESAYTPKLLSFYGKTPDWFVGETREDIDRIIKKNK